MPLLAIESPLGQLDLVLVDGRIGLGGIHATFTEEALQHRLDNLFIR